MAALEAPTTAPLDDRRQSAAIVNSDGQILVVEGEFADGVPWVGPQGTVRPFKACVSSSEKLSDSLDGISGVLESTVLMLRERFGLEVGPHVVPVQVMDERHVVDNVQWVLFRCTDVIGDLHASFMSRRCTDVHGRALGVVTWQWMEEVIEQTPSAKRAPLEALYAWAAPVLSVHEAAAKATDFSGYGHATQAETPTSPSHLPFAGCRTRLRPRRRTNPTFSTGGGMAQLAAARGK